MHGEIENMSKVAAWRHATHVLLDNLQRCILGLGSPQLCQL